MGLKWIQRGGSNCRIKEEFGRHEEERRGSLNQMDGVENLTFVPSKGNLGDTLID